MGDADRLGQLMDENFDTRRSIYNLSPWQVQMVETARRCGASAKFAGSGGAIIGTYRDEAMFEQTMPGTRRAAWCASSSRRCCRNHVKTLAALVPEGVRPWTRGRSIAEVTASLPSHPASRASNHHNA